MADGTFKSKLFGGFDRKDVVSYIEKLASERNGYITKCRELEEKVQEYTEKIESMKMEHMERLGTQKAEFEEEIARLKKEHEEKISELEAEVALANIRAEEKRTKEKEEAKEVLNSVSEKFNETGSDAQLVCAHLAEELDSLKVKIEKLPDAIISSKERIEEIKEKLD